MMEGVLVDNMSMEILLAPIMFFGVPLLLYILLLFIWKD